MSLKYSYGRLSASPTELPGPLSEVKLTDYAHCEHRNNKWGTRIHWIVHIVSLILIISLFTIAISFHDGTGEMARCWNMQNYYCKLSSQRSATQTYTKTSADKIANSPCQCCFGHTTTHHDTIQWLLVVRFSIQRPTDPSGRGGMALYHAIRNNFRFWNRL